MHQALLPSWSGVGLCVVSIGAGRIRSGFAKAGHCPHLQNSRQMNEPQGCGICSSPRPVATNFSFSQIVPDFFFLNTYFPLRVAPAILPHLSLRPLGIQEAVSGSLLLALGPAQTVGSQACPGFHLCDWILSSRVRYTLGWAPSPSQERQGRNPFHALGKNGGSIGSLGSRCCEAETVRRWLKTGQK